MTYARVTCGEVLDDADWFATQPLVKADSDGPDIVVHGTRGAYTVEVSNALEELGSRAVWIGAKKMRWVVEAIRMRQDTLRRIAEGFLDLQVDVPEQYRDQFKPVSVRQLGEQTHLHETTVTSAVANKVIAFGGRQIRFDTLVTAEASHEV